MNPVIRLARETDAAPIQSIYAPIVRETAISFEIEPPTIAEMRNRIIQTLERFPWLVCEHHGEIRGYAYASPHRIRPAYQWSVDVSAYVHDQTRRAGVGRALYVSLLAHLRLQGFRNAYAGIALPNPASVGLHETLGFEPVGIYRGVGYKHGAWHDVGWWQLDLRADSRAPAPPASPADLAGAAVAAALAGGLPFLRL